MWHQYIEGFYDFLAIGTGFALIAAVAIGAFAMFIGSIKKKFRHAPQKRHR